MPLDLLTLSSGTLQQASSLASGHKLYAPANTGLLKTAIVHGMRFTNVTSGTVKIQVFFLKSGGAIGTDERRVLEKDLAVPAGYTVLDEDQITLGSGDGICAFCDMASAVDFAISGSERPV